MIALLFTVGCFALASAAPTRRWLTNPSVKYTQSAGVAIDPNYQRDSCLSVPQLVDGRAFWTCRDTEVLTNQSLYLLFNNTFSNFISSSGSWSNQNASNLPDLVPIPANQGQKLVTEGYSQQLTQYGSQNVSFLTVQQDECGQNQAGSCSDGTRYPIWPDTPPFVASSDNSETIMYQFVRVPHIGPGLAVDDYYPPCSLYKIVYTSTTNTNELPEVTIVQEDFWAAGTFSYGDYGAVVSPTDGNVYLYGQSYQGNTSLARVPTGSVEDKSAYEFYYNNGTWSNIAPQTVNDSSAWIVAGAGGQGSYFYSDHYNNYLWLGQNTGFGVPDLYASAASSPEGPWLQAEQIATFPAGNATDEPSYTLVAHPELGANSSQVYISYTTLDEIVYAGKNESFYKTPLYLIEWNEAE